jgi:hypothetical protein
VQEKVERARTEALTGGTPEEGEQPGPDGDGESAEITEAAPGEPAGTRYVRGRRLRTY